MAGTSEVGLLPDWRQRVLAGTDDAHRAAGIAAAPDQVPVRRRVGQLPLHLAQQLQGRRGRVVVIALIQRPEGVVLHAVDELRILLRGTDKADSASWRQLTGEDVVHIAAVVGQLVDLPETKALIETSHVRGDVDGGEAAVACIIAGLSDQLPADAPAAEALVHEDAADPGGVAVLGVVVGLEEGAEADDAPLGHSGEDGLPAGKAVFSHHCGDMRACDPATAVSIISQGATERMLGGNSKYLHGFTFLM